MKTFVFSKGIDNFSILKTRRDLGNCFRKLSLMFRLLMTILGLSGLAILAEGNISPNREEIDFSGDPYYLAKSVGDSNGIWNLYLPKGRSAEDWNRSISIRLYYKQDEAESLMENQKKLVNESFSDAQIATQVTRDGKEARLRYVVQTQKPLPLSQFSMWRFIELREPRVQVLAYQFTFREFTDDLERFQASLDQRLEEWTKEFLRVRFNPPEFRVKTRAIDSLETRGITLIQEGEAGRGLSLMIDAVNQDPQNPVRHFNLGQVIFTYAKGLLEPETMEEAMLLFNQAQDYLEEADHLFEVFDPGSEQHSQTLFYLGEVEFHIKENYEKAELYYRRALKMDPLNRDARDALKAYPRP